MTELRPGSAHSPVGANGWASGLSWSPSSSSVEFPEPSAQEVLGQIFLHPEGLVPLLIPPHPYSPFKKYMDTLVLFPDCLSQSERRTDQSVFSLLCVFSYHLVSRRRWWRKSVRKALSSDGHKTNEAKNKKGHYYDLLILSAFFNPNVPQGLEHHHPFSSEDLFKFNLQGLDNIYPVSGDGTLGGEIYHEGSKDSVPRGKHYDV